MTATATGQRRRPDTTRTIAGSRNQIIQAWNERFGRSHYADWLAKGRRILTTEEMLADLHSAGIFVNYPLF